MSNLIGNHYRVMVFGQSHAPSIGAVIEGLPAGFRPDWDAVRAFMARRAPGGKLATSRREADLPEILSGLNERGETCGAPLAMRIVNGDTKPQDYAKLRDVPRPGHADYPAYVKFGGANDIRGGGQFSGRLTAPLCFAGALALQLLAREGIRIRAHIARIENAADAPLDPVNPDLDAISDGDLAVIDPQAAEAMRRAILDAKADCDSVGGEVECFATGVPAGLGDPMFDGVENRLARALFGIPRRARRGVRRGLRRLRDARKRAQRRLPDAGRPRRDRDEPPRRYPGRHHHGDARARPRGVQADLVHRAGAAFRLPLRGRGRRAGRARTARPLHCAARRARRRGRRGHYPLRSHLGKERFTMELNDIRARIDGIDADLTKLFVERMQTVADVAAAKQSTGKAVRDRARERSVINRVTAQAGDAYAPYVRDLYRLIFELSCNYQSALMGEKSALGAQIEAACAQYAGGKMPNRALVACQGTEGAYAQQACEKLFEYPDILYFNSFDGVFNAVEKGMCEYGILPIENSTAGSVTQVYDLMEKHSFHIVGARRLRVEHQLMRKKGASGPIREVVSHEQALRQCSEFFDAHPEYTPVPMANTAVAAEFAATTERDDVAVIASKACAELYNLEVVQTSVSNAQSNYTRFICISRNMEIYPDARKVSIMFNLPHEAGSLNAIISRLAIAGVNLTKLESRPMPGREFEFRFFFDLEADVHDPEIVKLLCELERRTERFVFLGAYEER